MSVLNQDGLRGRGLGHDDLPASQRDPRRTYADAAFPPPRRPAPVLRRDRGVGGGERGPVSASTNDPGASANVSRITRKATAASSIPRGTVRAVPRWPAGSAQSGPRGRGRYGPTRRDRPPLLQPIPCETGCGHAGAARWPITSPAWAGATRACGEGTTGSGGYRGPRARGQLGAVGYCRV